MLREKAKQQGFDIQGIANSLQQHRVTVEKDFRAERVSQKVLKKYAKVLDISIGDFYPTHTEAPTKAVSAPSENLVIELYKQLIKEKDERIKLLENQLSFFPSAVQLT